MLTSRERVLCALNHEEPDRVPIFFGTSGATTVLTPGYERFKAYLGFNAPPRLISRALQYAMLDEEILLRYGSDGRPLLAGAAPSTLRREIDDVTFCDDWGITWQRRPGIAYYEMIKAPLREATIDDLEKYPWPDVGNPERFKAMAEQAKYMHEHTPFAVVALTGVTLHEQIYMLRDLEMWLMDLIANPEFAQALLRKVADLGLASLKAMLEAIGPYVDVLITGDDLGTQSSLMMSPKTYRKMIKPYHAELIAAMKSRTKAKVFFHSDGNVYPLLGDLIEVGVDLLNPVQVNAGDMGDTARLKREFGKQLAFCGGIDTGWVLPSGTPADVRAEVRRRIHDLAPGGGYCLAAVHCIQHDVPPENIHAMLDEALISGRYPIRV